MTQKNNRSALIYTLFDKPNFGCFLQVFAMSEVLRSFNFNPFVARIPAVSKPKALDEFFYNPYYLVYKNLVKLKSKLSSNQTQQLALSHSPEFLESRSHSFVNAFKCLQVVDTPFSADVSIFGSDEIWNISNNGFDHYLEYFGFNTSSKIKIAYAPSIASCRQDLILRDRRRSRLIKKLDFVFPRDSATLDLVNKLRSDNPNIVVDPTVLIADWSKHKSQFRLDYDYILYYGYSPSPKLIKWLKMVAAENSLKLICLNFEYLWCDQSIACSPFDFLAVLEKASFAVTDTFHGCIFSTLLNKNFIAVDPSKKAYDFMRRFDQIDIVYSSIQLDDIDDSLSLFHSLTKQSRDMKIKEARGRSLGLFYEALCEENKRQ